MITLCSGRLRVELADPGEAPNNRYRFDHSGYIMEVILDKTIRFCASEPQNLNHPCSGGRGLCNEYRFDASREAQIGEYFPKFGVGLIRKEEEEKYIFHKAYKEVQLYPVHVHQKDNSVTYITEPVPCLGYAVRNTKNITVADNMITMTIQVENTGEKAIEMREFCHNFISIDGMATGSDYRLDMPGIYDMGTERLIDRNGQSSGFRGNGKGITFCEHTAIGTDHAIDTSKISRKIPFTWRLFHMGARAYVEAEEFYVPSNINIWGVDHMLCPEINHLFTVNPGEVHEWKRTWTFDQWY